MNSAGSSTACGPQHQHRQQRRPADRPRDIDSLEVERGSYSADLGDRTYGMFNVLTRSGFERSREGELVLTAGNFYQTNDSSASRPQRKNSPGIPASAATQQPRLAVGDLAARQRRGERTRRLRILHLQPETRQTSFAWSHRCAATTTRFPGPRRQRLGERSLQLQRPLRWRARDRQLRRL